jgi:5-hydroxyisourate hydrolase
VTSLSTHVLDTALGLPASGVRVELTRAGKPVAAAETNADGRADLARELEPGVYRIAFSPPSPFFTRVELEVVLGDGHYHVPLLISPYGCASYRDSSMGNPQPGHARS